MTTIILGVDDGHFCHTHVSSFTNMYKQRDDCSQLWKLRSLLITGLGQL